eukprot:scaffold122631_cov69-Phaeocystis_antarctica.AAC.1
MAHDRTRRGTERAGAGTAAEACLSCLSCRQPSEASGVRQLLERRRRLLQDRVFLCCSVEMPKLGGVNKPPGRACRTQPPPRGARRSVQAVNVPKSARKASDFELLSCRIMR